MTYATPLGRKLAAHMAEHGPISVHDYMEACLYDAAHGYYRGKGGIGRSGDFITAPEISQIFGELIGLWAGEVWRQMGEPRAVRLIELGPGRGVLMADALRALKVAKGFLDTAAVHLVETSQPLREAQKAALAGRKLPLFWHENLQDVPEGPSIVIANEFFDCLPVRQAIFDGRAQGWRERTVTGDGGALRFEAGPLVAAPPECEAADSIEDGAIFEHRPALREMFNALSARSPCAALIIDYGYARRSFGDTIQAVKAHRFVHLFEAPGETDITAHVDFGQMKQAAADAGLAAFGPMPMGEWLLRMGLEARLDGLTRGTSESEARSLGAAAARLVDPAQMGVLFKVLAVSRGISASPPPFGNGDV